MMLLKMKRKMKEKNLRQPIMNNNKNKLLLKLMNKFISKTPKIKKKKVKRKEKMQQKLCSQTPLMPRENLWNQTKKQKNRLRSWSTVVLKDRVRQTMKPSSILTKETQSWRFCLIQTLMTNSFRVRKAFHSLMECLRTNRTSAYLADNHLSFQ